MRPIAWRRLKIGTQLIAGFGLVLGTMALVLGLALANFARLGSADEQREAAGRRIELVQALLLDVVNMETGLRGFVASGKEPFLEPFTQGRQRYAQHLDEAKAALAGETAQLERLQRLADGATAFAQVADKLIAARRDATQLMSGTEELVAQFSEGRDKKATDAIRQEAQAIEQAEKALQHTLAEQSASLRKTTTFVMTAGGLVALAFGALLAIGLARAIGRPLAQAVEASRRIATGDLTVALDHRRDDEIGALLRSLHDMQQSLQQAVHGVRENAERVAHSSGGIAEGNGALRDRTDAQAASLQQATASVSQLHQTVQRNEEDAVQARQLALSASQVAARGGQVVSEVVSTMQGISEASRRIADITGVIDGIAFQTNILALNAAVEAARAGEQGRGFAVVAGEVRTLAQRSAEAAREIKQLIGTSVERVEQGSTLVDQAGGTMQEIVQAIERVSGIVQAISDSSRAQGEGLGQVNQAVTDMDRSTRENASLVQHSAAAAENLSEQAQALVQAVAVFRLREA